MTESFKKTVDGPIAYREAAKHASALGFEPESAIAHGRWEAADGATVFISGHSVDVEKVTWKYFHAEIDGSITPIHPVNGDEMKDDGSLTVVFEEQ